MTMDAIDQAVAAAAADQPEGTETVRLEQVTVTISATRRPFVVAFPPDMTDTELLEVASWVLVNLRAEMAKRRAANPASRILIPR
jgi:hypothetical protein